MKPKKKNKKNKKIKPNSYNPKNPAVFFFKPVFFQPCGYLNVYL